VGEGPLEPMDFTRQDINEVFNLKHGDLSLGGWSPRLARRFGYFSPDDIYETIVAKLVERETTWLDVGCGSDIFPSNRTVAQLLSERCELLVGVDPSENVEANPFVHQRFKGMLEDYMTDIRFDLVTLRMVAEHVTNPQGALEALSRLVKPGGKVVIYTVNKWAPVTIVSALVPFSLHHRIKRFFWDTDEKDTFPTAYLMNTRQQLQRQFSAAGFLEVHFEYLDDCRTLGKWPVGKAAELIAWKIARALGLHYPETCLLGVYEMAAAR
jgi:2-polyprenyl-3-methyl-5-hydroxy-6-metoxy-1,4-benzoquinol methylase